MNVFLFRYKEIGGGASSRKKMELGQRKLALLVFMEFLQHTKPDTNQDPNAIYLSPIFH